MHIFFKEKSNPISRIIYLNILCKKLLIVLFICIQVINNFKKDQRHLFYYKLEILFLQSFYSFLLRKLLYCKIIIIIIWIFPVSSHNIFELHYCKSFNIRLRIHIMQIRTLILFKKLCLLDSVHIYKQFTILY